MSIRENAETLAIGYMLTIILSFIFAFFPAMIFGVQVCELTWGHMDKGGSYICGLIGIFIGWFIVRCFIVKASSHENSNLWLYIAFIYLFCLWPFIQLVMFFMGNGEYEQSVYKAEFPGFDWIPFI